VAERFALPVCTTVVPPFVASEAAPNAAPAAAPLAIGWLLWCSSGGGACCAGGGACAGGACSTGGACCSGGGVCEVARGAIAIMTASAVIRGMSVLNAFIRPSFNLPLLLVDSPLAIATRSARPLSHVDCDASCYREMHCRAIPRTLRQTPAACVSP
jgi:hypothetical protein